MKFGKRLDGPAGRRWLKRRKVGISGFAVFAGDSRSVLIQDLSISGAKLFGRDLPPTGTDLKLKVGDRSVHGRVAWDAGDHRGIRVDFGRIP